MPYQPDNMNDSGILFAMDELFNFCQKHQVSDLHFEPNPPDYTLRLRIQDILYQYEKIPSSILIKIIQRIKILSQLDLSNKRTPQDGQWLWKNALNNEFSCRVSTCPLLFGEKMVVRLLKKLKTNQSWQTLGCTLEQENIIQKIINHPQGLILVNGPTGAGKTTTLYKIIEELNNGKRNIITIEDPIEIPNPKISQVEINRKLGLSISTILKNILRQDPDIILVGEIRDIETAQLVLEAAQTGHLVLSSLHSSSCIESMLRLKHLKINMEDLSHSLLGIIAQRLIRCSCYHCNSSCSKCHDGYTHRQAVFEILNFNSIETTFKKNIHRPHLLDNYIYPTIEQRVFELYEQNQTRYEEVIRVLGEK